LRATPDPSELFVRWGQDAAGGQNPLTLTLNSNKIITAEFSAEPKWRIQRNGTLDEIPTLTISLDQPLGGVVQLDTSTNLTSWRFWQILTNNFGLFEFTHEIQSAEKEFIYRMRKLN
jgi:hypothetical protein